MAKIDKAKIKRICKKLEDLWLKYPSLRLGQLLENFVFVEGKRGDGTSIRLFYQADGITEIRINKELGGGK